jgi:predicted dehydrogenase
MKQEKAMNDDSRGQMDRRTLIKSAGAAALGFTALAEGANQAAATKGATKRRRFAIVGLGSRSLMYTKALTETYTDRNELVAMCDTNPGRLALRAQIVGKVGASPQTYAAKDFERMIAETKPDAVIVTSPDATHDGYLVRTLDAGCDAITEKPMTTTPEKAQGILDACARNKKHIRVLFNYRYSPPRTQVKDLLMQGVIGDILSVDFNWLLNTQHGADYFRRWHSHKQISGGLMVHKATHHFDLVNWWLGSQPELVLSYGKREFYTPATARRMGLKSHHERCHTCPESSACTFYMDLAADPAFKTMYLDQEHHDGYFRDQCVFRPEIDIEDTMNVIVRYKTGATLSYSLNACNAWEGYQIAFNGTKGRLEHRVVEQMATFAGATGGDVADDRVTTRVIPLRGAPQEIQPWTGTGGHGGGDKVMLDEVFGSAEPDKYQRASDERSGAYSMLIGAAANRCFQTGQAVRIADLVTGLTAPDMAPMPTREMTIPMPRKV